MAIRLLTASSTRRGAERMERLREATIRLAVAGTHSASSMRCCCCRCPCVGSGSVLNPAFHDHLPACFRSGRLVAPPPPPPPPPGSVLPLPSVSHTCVAAPHRRRCDCHRPVARHVCRQYHCCPFATTGALAPVASTGTSRCHRTIPSAHRHRRGRCPTPLHLLPP